MIIPFGNVDSGGHWSAVGETILKYQIYTVSYIAQYRPVAYKKNAVEKTIKAIHLG